MRFDKRKAFFGLLVTGAAGAVLFPFAVYFIGVAVAPPRPEPAQKSAPSLIANAIWARADGGRATGLTPMTHVSVAQFMACVAIEDFKDTTPGDARRVAACREYMPAVQAVEYLSGVHMRDGGLETSFREGLGRFSTMVWLTHSWTKAEFLNAVAERGEFGKALRGAEAASRHYFGRPAEELSLAQAALLAAFIGDRFTAFDPWCEPAAAADMRGRVLQKMRDNLSIDDAGLSAANTGELDLGPPPADHKPCPD